MNTPAAKPICSLSAAVDDALAAKQPVVALESTIISHGMPWPDNFETALKVEEVVRQAGAVPATVAIIGGQPRAGLTQDELERLARAGTSAAKVSLRDLPIVAARHMDGATTVAATMRIAASAGIPVFATGGIGGVHRGVERTLDVSADLTELGKTPVAVVCAGIKSVLDIPKTLEYLETLGVPVLGYQSDELPAFYARSSGQPVDARVESAAEIADILSAKRRLQLEGGVIIANPVPEAHALAPAQIDGVIDEALAEADARGIRGKDITPFLLGRIAERSGGDSLAANIALIRSNARLAAEIAVALSNVEPS